ncbi:class I SAM-dependent methyltransferase [Luteitalea pratensis]|uniref:class I SAM-dependent methyltransferase n=1 Tax=Luteitalea pratensis TaxID=1855912 RepID=UPI0012FFB2E6|nr:class I SAM-dependent methyltransferase [Luteitalea pratensis]
MFTTAQCETEGAAIAAAMQARMPAWVGGNISVHDQPLLAGLTVLLAPSKVVEIGVASGWSGCLFIEALSRIGRPAEYIGIDASPTYYLDHVRPTGAAIGELFPTPPVATRLLLGQMAADTVDVVGPGVELAFIDGDHRHPWALLDLLALLPVLAPSSHVLMHDLHLCTYERHKHTNRGPKYLFEAWPGPKVHSSQRPPMIGAIQLPPAPDPAWLTIVLDTLHTPWETPVPAEAIAAVARSVDLALGTGWAARFRSTLEAMNAEAARQAAMARAGSTSKIGEAVLDSAARTPDPTARAALLEEAANYLPADARIHHALAVALQRLQRLDAALVASARALTLSPRNASVVSFHGQLLAESEDLAQAEVLLRRAIDLDDQQPAYHGRLSRLLARQGRVAEAITHAQRSMSLAPGDQARRSELRDLEARLETGREQQP